MRHRHQQYPVRVRCRLGRDHQEQPQRLRAVLRSKMIIRRMIESDVRSMFQFCVRPTEHRTFEPQILGAERVL